MAPGEQHMALAAAGDPLYFGIVLKQKMGLEKKGQAQLL